MMRRLMMLPALVLTLALAPAAARAQESPPELVDRVAAVVGDSVLLVSDVLAEVERLRASGAPVPTEGDALAEFRRTQLESLINEMLILQAAERDSIFILAEDVQPQVDAQIAQLERQFGGRAGLEAAMAREGLTVETYRETMTSALRRNQVRRQYLAILQRDRKPPPVSDAEVAEFFEESAGQLGMRPATIEFRQIVVAPEPADSARQAAIDEARDVLQQLLDGAEFSLLARRHSDDPGTRERGGELGWFRRGRFVPEFEAVAFALQPGQISQIVETSFGFHIIKVDKARGPERQVSHILIRPEITPADEARTVTRAEDVAAKLRAGASLDSLTEAVHDDAEEEHIGPAVLDSLPAPYNVQLTGAEDGETIGPFEIPGGKYAVVRVLSSRPEGPYSPTDPEVRDQIRALLQQDKLLEEVLTDLRRRTWIDIRY